MHCLTSSSSFPASFPARQEAPLDNFPPPYVITRDFSTFPWPLVERSEEDTKHLYKSICFKIQTPAYIAYIPLDEQEFITPEHLYNAGESEGMLKARMLFWGHDHLRGTEKYEVHLKYPKECAKVGGGKDDLFDKVFEKRKHLYPEDFCKKYAAIKNKYTIENFIWESLAENFHEYQGRIKVISGIALTIIALTVFFCSSSLPRRFLYL